MFHTLQHLSKHIDYLHSVLDTQTIFLVGGCIRDVLLGVTQDPDDIDVTLAGNPEHIRQHMHFKEEHMSRFRTEKYGTITIIPKKHKQTDIPHVKGVDETERSEGASGGLPLSYEITPFRTEGTYTDVRHPDDIERSTQLLVDSKRRDFTINCLYFTNCTYDDDTRDIHKKTPTTLNSKEKIIQLSNAGKDFFLPDTTTLILQNHNTIQQAFPDGIIDMTYILDHIHHIERYHTPDHAKKNKEEMQKKKKQTDIGSTQLHIIVDPQGGIKDLLARKITTVGNPDDRFTEDALRILRGIRFPNILNQQLPNNTQQNACFDIEKSTRASMQQHIGLISSLAKERLHEELVKVFAGENPFGYICLLDEIGGLKLLFPALAACKHNEQPIRYHPFDTYTHTLLTLHALQGENTHYLAKLAMLYHDVGKPDQYEYIAEQKAIHGDDPIDMSGYLHHPETGSETAKKEFSQLGFSKKEIEEIARYILRHHRPGEILNSNKKNRLKKIRQLLSEGGLDQTMHLLDIAIADRNGQFNPLQPAAIHDLLSMKESIQELHANEGRFTMKELAVSGNDLIKNYHLAPGPELGEILAKCFDRVLSDVTTRNTKKMILTHVKTLL